jgi:hypothetical protein
MRDRLELRAQHPVAQCLIRRLMVPRVYFDADWPGFANSPVDVLVIDRDGTGDPHLVEIKRSAAEALALSPSLLDAHAPYRWIAFLRGTEDAASEAALISQTGLYREQVAGRIGVIEIVKMTGDELGANVRLAAERFPTPAYEMASAYSDSHEAQIQFGG